jgi:hypothetical protein
MKKLLMGFAVATAGIVVAGATLAGTKGTHDVSIVVNADGSYNAGGQLGDSRASLDHTSEVGCYTSATTTSVVLTCFARNSSGTVSCYSSNANILQAAATLTANADVNFSAAYNGGECLTLTAYTASWATPVQP